MDIGRVEPDPSWQIAAHAHAFHQLIVVLDGVIHVKMRGQTFRAGMGELMWYPAGVAHQEEADREHPCETLYMGIDWSDAPKDWPLSLADRDGRISQLARWLYTERASHYPERARLRTTFVRAIMAEYQRLSTYRQDPLVDAIRHHVRQNLSASLALDDLVRLTGLSKYHLVRRYKALTGRTPMEDVRHIRMMAARELLLTTNLPLKEIAPRTGLGDAYRLCRLFRQHFHMTTSALRRW
jgi:AraC-like DNA-binding protein